MLLLLSLAWASFLFDLASIGSAPYGCMLELTIQLAILMVGDIVIGNVKEVSQHVRCDDVYMMVCEMVCVYV